MVISTFPSLHEALDDILPLDQGYSLITLQLEAKNMIAPFHHNTAHEWVLVAAKSEIDVLSGVYRKEQALVSNVVTIIHFPPKRIHGLAANTPIKYFVIRSSTARALQM